MTDQDDDDQINEQAPEVVDDDPHRQLREYGKLGGRPPNPGSLVELAERKLIYGSMTRFWRSRQVLSEQLSKIDLDDNETLKKRKNDHIMVQAIKAQAREYHAAEPGEAKQKALTRLWSAIAKVDDSMAQTQEQQVRIALAVQRLNGAKGASENDEPQTAQQIAQTLRDSGMSEDEIRKHMGTGYPGEP
jgi:hypothetical protein